MDMKAGYLRGLLAAASALLLASCGGYTGVSIGGTVTWLDQNGQPATVAAGATPDSVILNTNGMSVTVAQTTNGTAASYTFPGQVQINSTFNVTVQQQPIKYTCTMGNANGNIGATGTVGGQNINYISTTCNRNTYALSGTVNNLTGAGLVLANGSDTVTVSPSSPVAPVIFTFPKTIVDGGTYSVAVLTQPSGQTCTVSNGIGVMPTAAVTTVVVNCSP
jgi:hypothetical protein